MAKKRRVVLKGLRNNYADSKRYALELKASIRVMTAGVNKAPPNTVLSLRGEYTKLFNSRANAIASKYIGRAVKRAYDRNASNFAEIGITPNLPQKVVTESIIKNNVSLIKSIPQKYFDRIEKILYNAKESGAGADDFRQDIQELSGVTYRRAELIANDQLQKATVETNNAMAVDVGIKKARWIHVAGLKTARETHKEFDGKEYQIGVGLYDRDVNRNVEPAELVNCRCTCEYIFE